MTVPESDHPTCRYCRKPIEPEATKCTECDCWQDWRGGYFSGTATVVLPLLVALLSVFTAAVPAIKWLFSSDRANIRLSVVKKDQTAPATITIMAANIGTLSGFLENPVLIVHRRGKAEKELPLTFADSNNHMIAHGEARELNLKLNMGLDSDVQNEPCQLEIKMNVTDYKKTDLIGTSTTCVSR